MSYQFTFDKQIWGTHLPYSYYVSRGEQFSRERLLIKDSQYYNGLIIIDILAQIYSPDRYYIWTEKDTGAIR